MPPAHKVVTGTIETAGRTTALLGVRVARALYGRWWRMSATDREPLGPLAEEVKARALDLRGEADPEAARQDLEKAGERLAAAIVETAESDPDVSEIEVSRLRQDLARELDRLASAEIRASRGGVGKNSG